MKILVLIKKLSKLDLNMTVIGFDGYDERLTKDVDIEVRQHSGTETDCWNSSRKFHSNIPKGTYLYISIGET